MHRLRVRTRSLHGRVLSQCHAQASCSVRFCDLGAGDWALASREEQKIAKSARVKIVRVIRLPQYALPGFLPGGFQT
jgi:hypothetical protein